MTRKILTSLFFLLGAFMLEASSGVELMQNVTTSNTTFPIYDKGKLVAILFGEEVKNTGKLIEVSGPMVDIAKNSLDINLIKVGKTEVYELNSSLQEVVDFWKNRIVFSDGVAVSNFANVDQKARQAFGKEDIFFRSPALDIDGKGYHVNYKDSTCLIRSNVKIVARSGEDDVRKVLENGKLPEESSLIRAKSEQLFLDLKKNYVELTGNVEVNRVDGTIYCDKMLILLAKNNEDKVNSTFNMGDSSAKVSEIICSGNVRLVRSEKNGKSNGGVGLNFFGYMDNAVSGDTEMIYCADKNTSTQEMQFDTTTIGADNLKWIFGKNLIVFEGNVKMRDRSNTLECNKVVVKLAKEDKKTVINEILCSGNVDLKDDSTQLLCSLLRINFVRVNGVNELKQASAYDNIKLINGKKESSEKSVLTAKKGVLYFLENRAEFHNNVKVVDKEFILNAEKLFIYAKEIPAGDKIVEPETGTVPDRIKINEKLELDYIEALENVVIERSNEGDDSEKAYGEKGVYTVAQKKIVLTGTKEKTPVITRGRNTLRTRENGRVVVDLEEESAYVEEGADLELKDRGSLK